MKKLISAVLTAAVLTVLFPLPALGQVEGRLSFLSRYIWRGFDLNPRNRPVLEAAVDVAFGGSGFALQLKEIFSFHDREVNEFNAALSYGCDVGGALHLRGGLIHYGWYFAEAFAFRYDTSHELFIEASLPRFILRPSLTAYYDFHNGDGFYAEFRVGQRFSIRKWVGFRPSAVLGFNGGQWLADRSDAGLSELNFMLEIPMEWKALRLTPFFRYTAVLLDVIGRDSFPVFGAHLVFTLR